MSIKTAYVVTTLGAATLIGGSLVLRGYANYVCRGTFNAFIPMV